MSETDKTVEREIEMNKILDVNQEDNVEVTESLNHIGSGLDQNKSYYKKRGLSSKLGTYGGFGNASSKTRFTILLLLVIIAAITTSTVFRHTHKIYDTYLTGYMEENNDILAGDNRVRFNSSVRVINTSTLIDVTWYNQDGDTEVCSDTTYPFSFRPFAKHLSVSCQNDDWQAGEYYIEFSVDDKVIYIEEFEVVD